MKIEDLIQKLKTLDPKASVVIFTEGEFHLLDIKEYDCNCGSMPKMYYITKEKKDNTKSFLV